jgi:selenoprotein W-related protein
MFIRVADVVSSVMVTVEIEYCVPCGHLHRALDIQQTILEEFGRDVDGVRLIPGSGGVFKIYADEETLWDKDAQGSGLDLDLITDDIRERVQASA